MPKDALRRTESTPLPQRVVVAPQQDRHSVPGGADKQTRIWRPRCDAQRRDGTEPDRAPLVSEMLRRQLAHPVMDGVEGVAREATDGSALVFLPQSHVGQPRDRHSTRGCVMTLDSSPHEWGEHGGDL